MAVPAPPSSQPIKVLSRSPSSGLLQPWFGLLAVLGLLACGRAILLPPWPRAQALNRQHVESVLTSASLAPARLATQPELRTENFSLSPLLRWSLAGGSELRLASVSVRRSSDFQVALFTKGSPQLLLKHRRLDIPRAGVASGLISGQQSLQTCLVPQSGKPVIGAVTAHFLNLAVNSQVSSLPARIRSLIGIGKPRQLRCILVTLIHPSGHKKPATTWQSVLATLQSIDWLSMSSGRFHP